ncbi:hypothetical protein FDO65_07140 [Nakamurella flava]|uniref:Uncharacterized protein n=1 Tax=Nakamurella flava TaxID=2576308 RepID=A0A4U6QLI1_9ACTN|nr:hypothetical protein [Nakamurella flava]TKV61363.1 hypothetical protein FDO65_07140 [Nakamurella flava]
MTRHPGDPASPQPDRVSCSRCGTSTTDPGLTWMSERDARRGPVWFCDRCARTHLRSIEAKLEQEYW